MYSFAIKNNKNNDQKLTLRPPRGNKPGQNMKYKSFLRTQLSIRISLSKEDFYIPVIKGHGSKRLKMNILISYERKYDTKQVYLIQVWLNFTVTVIHLKNYVLFRRNENVTPGKFIESHAQSLKKYILCCFR